MKFHVHFNPINFDFFNCMTEKKEYFPGGSGEFCVEEQSYYESNG
jgi:hypothetical protein